MRISPLVLVPVLFVGGVAAYLVADRAPGTPPEPVHAVQEPGPATPTPPTPTLPPDHPPVGDMSPHGAMGAPAAAGDQTAQAVTWTAPPSWQSKPNTSAMRLATFKVGDTTELTVVRAGGSVDQNITRWAGQFDGNPKPERTTRKVHGLDVTVVHIAGSYGGGGMMAPAEKHDGWAMLAAVVEAGGPPYFFKMVGPATEVDHAKAGFDSLIGSLVPQEAGGGGGGW